MKKLTISLTLVLTLLVLSFGSYACKKRKADTNDSQVSSSTRYLRAHSARTTLFNGQQNDLPFCPRAKALNLVNAYWLAIFAENQYSHFKIVAPELERIGFAKPGEGKFFQNAAYKMADYRLRGCIRDEDDPLYKPYEDAKPCEKEDQLAALSFEQSTLQGNSGSENLHFYSAGHIDRERLIFKKGSAQAVLAIHRKKNVGILAFRGTEPDEKMDIKVDVMIKKKHLNDNWGKVHKGFMNSLDSIRPFIEKELHKEKYKGLDLWITGHSLGGALATLMASKILEDMEGETIHYNLAGVYTFGSPRVGDITYRDKFAQTVKRFNIPFYRFRNGTDLVTRIPTGVKNKFYHVGTLVYFPFAQKGENQISSILYQEEDIRQSDYFESQASLFQKQFSSKMIQMGLMPFVDQIGSSIYEQMSLLKNGIVHHSMSGMPADPGYLDQIRDHLSHNLNQIELSESQLINCGPEDAPIQPFFKDRQSH